MILPDWHDLVAATWRREFLQGPIKQLWYDGWEFAVEVHKAVSAGELCLFHYPEHDTVFLIEPLTAYVGSVHVMSRGGIPGIAAGFASLLRDCRGFERLEIRTRYKSLAYVAQSQGCVFEGVTNKSFRNRHGKMVNEYILGYTQWAV